MNNQNRTADGRIASKKEAQRTDGLEMIARYMNEAKQAIWNGRREVAHSRVNACQELRAAFFADYAEAL